jgi:ESF2/ABP1 family protein
MEISVVSTLLLKVWTLLLWILVLHDLLSLHSCLGMLGLRGSLGEGLRCSPCHADPSIRKRRKQLGKNTGKNFTEGWVEFEDKAVAKQVAAMLNGNPMGGKRRSAYHYDLWCIKYLNKFKWDHLTEEIGG